MLIIFGKVRAELGFRFILPRVGPLSSGLAHNYKEQIMKKVAGVFALSFLLGTAGCTDPTDPNRKTKTGALVGAVAGAVIGHEIDHGSGAAVGAVVGALAGGGVGYYMDKQQQELEAELARERQAQQIEIQRLQDESLKLTVDTEVSFDFDSSQIKYDFARSLDKLADVIGKYDKTVVHVVGHTDSTGSDSYNQRLSERRAEAVAAHFRARGIASARIHTEGRGEREPRATNATEAGRQLNRRVEILLKPVVQGEEQKAHQAPASGARYY